MFMQGLIAFFGQSYPFGYRGRSLVIFVLPLTLLTFIFLYLFEPFNVYVPEQRMAFVWICLIQSLAAGLAFFVTLRLVASWVNDRGWTILKEMLLLTLALFMAGLVLFLIRDFLYDNPYNWSWKYLYEEVRNTFLVGVLLIATGVSLNFSRLLRHHKASAKALQLAGGMAGKQDSIQPLYIKTLLKGDHFWLDPSGFLFARSDGNYLEIFSEKDGQAIRSIKRVTIKEFEKQVAHLPGFLRTHRCCLVNLNKVTAVRGNAQGYLLSLEAEAGPVPVARNMIPAFKAMIRP